ncbi:phosphotransferase [Arthrobacter castelli]|uniref:phosphotransferase n=1 Tax=Arthrobacter castelli TaxID=271431 RepID=UPI000424DDF8|nr:phosphotransferase [Arthrobacter castelli]
MTEHELAGGSDSGAVHDDGTVHRAVGPWTRSVHRLLRHLAAKGFDRAPRPLDYDARGREVLTYLEGESVGNQKPFPAWVHSEAALVQVAAWLRDYHQAVADFEPADDDEWRQGREWKPGLIIGHNDAAPYNAAWHDGRLTGFFDWDLAGPVGVTEDIAFTAFAWVPLHARSVVAAEGFTDFAARPRRLRLFLDEYGWDGSTAEILDVAISRVTETARLIRELAAGGDPLHEHMVAAGNPDGLEEAARQMRELS